MQEQLPCDRRMCFRKGMGALMRLFWYGAGQDKTKSTILKIN